MRIIWSRPTPDLKAHELTKPAKDTTGTVHPIGWKFTLIHADMDKREVKVQASDGRLVTFR